MTRYSAEDVTWVRDNKDIAPKILTLLHDSFAYMDGRIDPPSSLRKLTAQNIQAHMEDQVLLTITDANTPIACAFLTEQADALYIGKLAVAKKHRGTGAGLALLTWAEHHAKVLNLPKLRLQTRIELSENHAIFAHYGFIKTAEGIHPGFTRPTEITMEKRL